MSGGAELRIDGVTKSYGDNPALRGVDLVAGAGSTTAILGPSGCGKTTLLRVIGGFERPDAGSVHVGDVEVVGEQRWVPPHKRDIGYVAQEGALFPHLTVAKNVAFGLPRGHDRARLRELLELVSLDATTLAKYPHELSGGQQQRVAIARALARRPQLILLDEPFSALDAGLRAATRAAVAEALAATEVTTVLVTHDQDEALSFADQVAVMHEGELSQVGTPQDVYAAPVDVRTAQFVGAAVLLEGVVSSRVATSALGPLVVRNPVADGPATLLLRPEQIRLVPAGDDQPQGRIVECTYYGHDAAVTIELTGSGHAPITTRQSGTNLEAVGAPVRIEILGSALAFPPDQATRPTT
jgi:iron(III) transport system ATP-binding protein